MLPARVAATMASGWASALTTKTTGCPDGKDCVAAAATVTELSPVMRCTDREEVASSTATVGAAPRERAESRMALKNATR